MNNSILKHSQTLELPAILEKLAQEATMPLTKENALLLVNVLKSSCSLIYPFIS